MGEQLLRCDELRQLRSECEIGDQRPSELVEQCGQEYFQDSTNQVDYVDCL